MANAPGSRLDLGELLTAVENAPPVAAADVIGERLAQLLGALDVSFLIADFSGRALARLGQAGSRAGRTQGRETGERVPLHDTAYGDAMKTQGLIIDEVDGETRILAPVTNRGEAIGVLEVTLGAPPDAQAEADVAVAAHALAYVVIANRRFTDLFQWGQRSTSLSLAAEIQHRLLPGTYTCEAGQFTMAAWLEPAGDIGGDTFDFAMERDTLHLSMTDAMGHTVGAAVLATVVVGALRNARRGGVDLAEQARRANGALGEYTESGGFVTGQVARVDLGSGEARIVNAGHPLPLRLRDGRVERVELLVDPPFGTVSDREYRVQTLTLLEGDRLMFLTDGMLERNAAGVDIAALMEAGAQLHPREAVQHLIRAVLEATSGELEDDATAMCLDWHGGPPRGRSTDAGANQ